MAKTFKPKAYASTSDAIVDFEKAFRILCSSMEHIQAVSIAEQDRGEVFNAQFMTDLLTAKSIVDLKELLRAQLKRETERGYMVKA